MYEAIINGSLGKLEAKYSPNKEQNSQIALVLHPHPLHGGTMSNKITYYMFKALQNNGFSVLRFNFPGVGRSEGQFDNGHSELIDASIALDWLIQNNPESRIIWVCGFSFGAWIALQLLMRRPEIITFVTAAPPVNLYDFNFLSPCPASGMIIQGTTDSIVPYEQVETFANKLNSYPKVEVKSHFIDGADHFFTNYTDKFQEVFNEYIHSKLTEDKERFANFKIGRRRRRSRKSLLNNAITPEK